VVLWNTRYIDLAVNVLRNPLRDENAASLSPFEYVRVNMLDRHTFPIVAAGRMLRRLRDPGAAEGRSRRLPGLGLGPSGIGFGQQVPALPPPTYCVDQTGQRGDERGPRDQVAAGAGRVRLVAVVHHCPYRSHTALSPRQAHRSFVG